MLSSGYDALLEQALQAAEQAGGGCHLHRERLLRFKGVLRIQQHPHAPEPLQGHRK